MLGKGEYSMENDKKVVGWNKGLRKKEKKGRTILTPPPPYSRLKNIERKKKRWDFFLSGM